MLTLAHIQNLRIPLLHMVPYHQLPASLTHPPSIRDLNFSPLVVARVQSLDREQLKYKSPWKQTSQLWAAKPYPTSKALHRNSCSEDHASQRMKSIFQSLSCSYNVIAKSFVNLQEGTRSLSLLQPAWCSG